MKRFFLMAILAVVIAWGTTSCVHEFPELPTTTEFTLHLNFDTNMPLYKEVTSTTRAANDGRAYNVRHIVSVHRLYADGNYSTSPDTVIVFTCNDTENLNCRRKFYLPEGDYNFFVWTDFVDQGTLTDKFYTAADFSEIILCDKNNYTGSCDYRDAFRGSSKATVTVKKNEAMQVDNQVTVNMQRPLAKYQFISTDYDEFVANVISMASQKNNASSNNPQNASINPDDYRVRFYYGEFVPCSYNMFTDKPADSWTGLQFESTLKPIGNGEIEMGFDYVFVNGAEAGVSVIAAVYNKDGQLVSASPTINVPLKRSQLTTVRGRFLTSTSTGGVDVNPNFDGEYNIEIH